MTETASSTPPPSSLRRLPNQRYGRQRRMDRDARSVQIPPRRPNLPATGPMFGRLFVLARLKF